MPFLFLFKAIKMAAMTQEEITAKRKEIEALKDRRVECNEFIVNGKNVNYISWFFLYFWLQDNMAARKLTGYYRSMCFCTTLPYITPGNSLDGITPFVVRYRKNTIINANLKNTYILFNRHSLA